MSVLTRGGNAVTWRPCRTSPASVGRSSSYSASWAPGSWVCTSTGPRSSSKPWRSTWASPRWPASPSLWWGHGSSVVYSLWMWRWWSQLEEMKKKLLFLSSVDLPSVGLLSHVSMALSSSSHAGTWQMLCFLLQHISTDALITCCFDSENRKML